MGLFVHVFPVSALVSVDTLVSSQESKINYERQIGNSKLPAGVSVKWPCDKLAIYLILPLPKDSWEGLQHSPTPTSRGRECRKSGNRKWPSTPLHVLF